MAATHPISPVVCATQPYSDQRPGTSGLRKKVAVFQQEHYVENFVQAVFNALDQEDVKGATWLVSGDGRYFSHPTIQVICEIAAANGVKAIWVAQNGLVSTPAASAIIRDRQGGVCNGAFLLTASHNPGGPQQDFGIKINTKNGGPAPEHITERIFNESKQIQQFKRIPLPAVDFTKLGAYHPIANSDFTIEIIDAVETWMGMMQQIFDFSVIKALLSRQDFRFVYDGMSGVAGVYARALFCPKSGGPLASSQVTLLNCEPKEDFGGGHPDPNLTYAKDLVNLMKPLNPELVTKETPDLGAAGDGDNDRNMILGKGFFVTPSDSVALIAYYATRCIPYFQKSTSAVKGLSRSMPTSCALDNVARELNVPLYEVPTGWKFFGNLMDAGKLSICGEESFGTGSDHIREKDGLWAVLAWLSILAHRNTSTRSSEGKPPPLVSVATIVKEFWEHFGRNYYSRYDYEQVDSESAGKLILNLQDVFSSPDINGAIQNKYTSDVFQFIKKHPIKKADSFDYVDPVDNTVSPSQGYRLFFEDGARTVWRLSGTGSTGATIRIYFERWSREASQTTEEALKDLIGFSLGLCRIQELTGRDAPTVIT